MRTLLLLLLTAPLSARAPGFFLLPPMTQGELVSFLKSPVMDRGILSEIAARREAEARTALASRRSEIQAELCSLPEAERPAKSGELQTAVREEHALFRAQLANYQAHIFRRMETEIQPAYRERALEARKAAFALEADRQALVEKSWLNLLTAKDPCAPAPLFTEKLILPYYLALFHYQAIFPAEERARTLLLAAPGK